MPDKILYSPKEGTTGFWGLREYPPTPILGSSKTDWEFYHLALESCKEKKLEIVNPEECFTYGPYARNGSNEVIKFKEGEIFDLPIGYEFKSYKKCQHNGIHNSTCIYHEVLRLVKTETKEENWKDFLIPFPPQDYPLRDGKEIKTWMDGYKQAVIDRPQPEPEESQILTKDEYLNILGVDRTHAIAMTIWDLLEHHNFIIQRKKQ